ncbi:dehydrogenase [Halogeometricum borinquense DSM 11551]|uniref:Dehydrogenase n=2 Tax=Halogeometricum borinquense TaxID=60847 RepID=E4NVI2_HALBP|nr:Gfo/Idh/MocA family oxidoreductase [Halogeometricum borinquense]ADQ68866.1 predicted dehydrogenase [Halogeometricum borinquense DSM 11551]ELY28706.1 dehydrogenase [Halogeometricum borinquense DSM 11551]RYJ08425.1 Gfo/Idh/MocA family oxidoreductase [Halogeometricum borinquense]
MTTTVGFVGAGGIAAVHLDSLDQYDGATLVAVADIDGERARAVADPRGATAYTDGHELIAEESESLDALVVAIPPFAHEGYEREAADAGIDLFVEKPVGLDSEVVAATRRELESSGVVTQVGYVCRYAQITDRARELLDGRQVAHVDSEYWVSVPDTSWWSSRAHSGGQLVEQSTHVFDVHRYLLGEVETVRGDGTDGLLADGLDFQDATSTTLSHESGAVSHISSTCASPESRFQVRVVADDAFLELDYFEHSLSGVVDGERVTFQGDGSWYQREFEAFLAAVRGRGDDVRSDYADAARTFEVTLAAREAAETGDCIDL